MSYKLQKPTDTNSRNNFIVKYNHNLGLLIREGTDTYNVNDLTFKGEFIFALEPNEIMQVEEAEIDVPDVVEEGEEQTYHKETVEIYKPVIDPDYEDKQKEKEKERIGNLQCTKRVFVLMLEKLGFDYFEQLKPIIEANRQASLEWELCERLERKNPLLDQIAVQFGVSAKQLDDLFKFANGEITQDEFLGINEEEENE